MKNTISIKNFVIYSGSLDLTALYYENWDDLITNKTNITSVASQIVKLLTSVNSQSSNANIVIGNLKINFSNWQLEWYGKPNEGFTELKDKVERIKKLMIFA